jgi:hypothetical protein
MCGKDSWNVFLRPFTVLWVLIFTTLCRRAVLMMWHAFSLLGLRYVGYFPRCSFLLGGSSHCFFLVKTFNCSREYLPCLGFRYPLLSLLPTRFPPFFPVHVSMAVLLAIRLGSNDYLPSGYLHNHSSSFILISKTGGEPAICPS